MILGSVFSDTYLFVDCACVSVCLAHVHAMVHGQWSSDSLGKWDLSFWHVAGPQGLDSGGQQQTAAAFARVHFIYLFVFRPIYGTALC